VRIGDLDIVGLYVQSNQQVDQDKADDFHLSIFIFKQNHIGIAFLAITTQF
jgi:hypothetical protein